MRKILITEVTQRGDGLRFYGVLEDGQRLPGVTVNAERLDHQRNGVMQVYPCSGFEGMTLEQCEANWQTGIRPQLHEVSPWGEDAIEAMFPKDATRWFVVGARA